MNKPTHHHCIAKENGGSNGKNNLNIVNKKPHQLIHNLFGNLLPHLVILYAIKLVGKPIKEDIKKQIEELLSNPGQIYKPGTIKNIKKYKEALNNIIPNKKY